MFIVLKDHQVDGLLSIAWTKQVEDTIRLLRAKTNEP
jgi:hypothetical protein